MAEGQYNAAAFTLANGAIARLQLDASGALKVTPSAGATIVSAFDQSVG